MPNWDKHYAQKPDGLFGNEPNEYVRQAIAHSQFPGQSALCIADGDGRNSRWLASQGLQTSAIDSSTAAIQNALALDKIADATIVRYVGDVETWQITEPQAWRSVFLIYLQAPWHTREAALNLCWKTLEPGGWFISEGFAKQQAHKDMGPNDPDLLYSLEEILETFKDGEIIEALEGQVHLNEGERHRGLANVVRVICRKSS